MLLDLKVKDFAIIENIHIEFTQGFNVLSGETGAGKSVLLKSLALLMGGKALTDSVRTGCENASIEGYFDLADRLDITEKLNHFGIDVSEESLIVRRIISSQGKSKVYMNGTLVPLMQLREIVSPLIEMTGEQAPLIEMTGQHDNKHLQNKSYRMRF
ncbi:MAG: AAA family ATPase [Bdellovibrionales bacterium]